MNFLIILEIRQILLGILADCPPTPGWYPAQAGKELRAGGKASWRKRWAEERGLVYLGLEGVL